MASEADKQCAVNALRGAEHALEAVKGQVLITKCLLDANAWNARTDSVEAAIDTLKRRLVDLHDDVYHESVQRQESEPRTGVIEPMSGGGSKGGNPL